MSSPGFRTIAIVCFTLFAPRLLPLARAETHVFYPVFVSPPEGGRVKWDTTQPAGTGFIEDSGSVKSDAQGRITFTFIADPGFTIKAITVNGHDFTNLAVTHGNSFFFDPAATGHTIGFTLSAITPTGTFNFPFPTSNTTITPIFNPSGHYVGQTPTRFHRNYALDIAVDTAGKIDALGTVDGLAQNLSTNRRSDVATAATSTNLDATVGQLGTPNGTPTAHYFGNFAGTRDGAPTSIRGSAKIPLEIYDVSGTKQLEGTGTYHAKVNGVKFDENNAPFSVPLLTGDIPKLTNKAWTFQLVIAQRTDANGKPFFGGSGQLTLQDGTIIQFDERKVRYSFRRGFVITFRNGTNTSLNSVDKKVSVTISHLTMALQSGVWKTTGGTIKYKFFGQKGSGPLVSFAP